MSLKFRSIEVVIMVCIIRFSVLLFVWNDINRYNEKNSDKVYYCHTSTKRKPMKKTEGTGEKIYRLHSEIICFVPRITSDTNV